MLVNLIKIAAFVLAVGVLVCGEEQGLSQAPQDTSQNPNAAAPQGGVQAAERGPVHEAFAAPTAEPKPSPFVNKKPPANIDEMPPEEKPAGDAVWISGYWHWDDEGNDYLWVSGCWRVKPPGKEWVPGYWRESDDRWQWVAGFWANAQPSGQGQQAEPVTAASAVTYYPEPPAPPAVAAPPPAPSPDMMYVPGAWVWYDGRYAWRAGYWIDGRPGYVWVASHYRWTPYGYVYIAGYWDLAIPNRGVLYAPVVINYGLVGPRFVYTPAYAVADSILLTALFIRPAYCHYYFGCYYGPAYVGLGYESCFVYSRRHYEPIVAYQVWTYRRDPTWLNVQINVTIARNAGRAPLPERVTIIQPAREVIVARGQTVVTVPAAARVRAMESARVAHAAAVEHRVQAERVAPGHTLTQPRQASAVRSAAPASHPVSTPVSHPVSPAANAPHAPNAPGAYKPSPFGSANKSSPATGPARPGTQSRPLPGRPPANTKPMPRRDPPHKDGH